MAQKVALYRRGIGDKYVIQSINLDMFNGVFTVFGNWGNGWEEIKITCELAVEIGLINPDAILKLTKKNKTPYEQD